MNKTWLTVCNLTIKHCDRTKVKAITVKNSKKLFKTSFLKTLKSDDVSTFTQRHFQVKMNKKKLLEYKCTQQILIKSLIIKSSAIKCEKIFARSVTQTI